jgi:hypothetical protein
MSKHAACECTSWEQHQARQDPPASTMRSLIIGSVRTDWEPCPGPLATVLVEKHRSEQMMREHLIAQAPWLNEVELDHIIRDPTRFTEYLR